MYLIIYLSFCLIIYLFVYIFIYLFLIRAIYLFILKSCKNSFVAFPQTPTNKADVFY